MKPIPNFPNYSITEDGTVYSHNKALGKGKGKEYDPTYCHKLKLKPSKDGYIRVNLRDENGKQRTRYIHRLVAECYIPNPDNLKTVNHKNEIKTDNRKHNLEWMTQGDNVRYSHCKILREMRENKQNKG